MVSNKPPNSEGNKRIGNQMANRQRFKPGMMNKQYNPMLMNNMRNMSAMFNANQLGDDPGFVDFNDDSIASTTNGTGNSNTGGPNAASSNVSDGGNKTAPFANGNRRMNPPMKRPMKNGGAPPGGMRNRMNGGGMANWGPPMPPPNMFPGPPAPAGRRGPMNPPPIPPPVPPAHFRSGPGMRMRGPQNGRYGTGMTGPMSLLSMNRPLPPPIPPMNGRLMPPPPGMGRMMPPPLRHGLEGPMRRNMNGGNLHGRGMGGKMGGPFARNGMAGSGGTVGLNGKRTRAKPAQLQNREEYPLDKPWVTADIKAEHDKKADLANRLKGHRDDALFAQFKEQRDKFVKMYEAARLEYIGKHPEQDVEKILTAPACKKARLENVDKTNAAADNTTSKTEETTSSSGEVVVTTTDPCNDSTKSDTNGCATASSSPSTTATTTTTTITTTIDTNDSTETTTTSPKDEQSSPDTELSPTVVDAATVECTVPV
ncbi:DNA-binding protein K10 [Anopheles maculipalpis]|uniref:DNA-binding protein K10 n=1 Tax=Anopheles maculipalpis TaxID=1496333 RepID=UPI002158C339|nr:DNA-binding protein K10 [Anopheles maculipalpis]